MSVAIRFDRMIPSVITESSSTPSTTYRPTIAEAPDRGLFASEAPESYRGRSLEGPEAGEGRASHMEYQFTHGRSQS